MSEEEPEHHDSPVNADTHKSPEEKHDSPAKQEPHKETLSGSQPIPALHTTHVFYQVHTTSDENFNKMAKDSYTKGTVCIEKETRSISLKGYNGASKISNKQQAEENDSLMKQKVMDILGSAKNLDELLKCVHKEIKLEAPEGSIELRLIS
jgi:thiol:disulfide interchange protein